MFLAVQWAWTILEAARHLVLSESRMSSDQRRPFERAAPGLFDLS